MPNSRFTRRAVLGATAAGLTLTSSPLSAQSAAAAGRAHSITVGIPEEILSLYPADVNYISSEGAADLMLEGLVGYDPDMNLIPVLAESFSANQTATEFTFHLRKGVHFHDGTSFDASAVKFDLEYVANPANHLKRNSLLTMLDHVDVVDQYTAKAVLKSSFGAFLPTFAHPALELPSPAAIRKYGPEVGRHPIGTGPFVFSSWSPDTLIVKRNARYWQPDLPHLSAITLKSNTEDGARIAMLEAGQAQFIYPVPPEAASLVTKNPQLLLHDDASTNALYMAMNVRKKPFDDVRVRRALNHAIDKAAFIRVVYNGYAKPLLSAEPPKITFYSEQIAYSYDPAKAKELLAEAGYPNGFATRLWGQNQTILIQAMQFLQQQLAAVGVNVSVESLENGVLESKIWGVRRPEDSTLEMYVGAWGSSTGDADWALRPLFATASFPPHLYNVGYYSNPIVDKDFEAGLATADATKRAVAYADAQRRIWEDAPWVFLAVPNIMSGQSKLLEDAYLLPNGLLFINGAKLA